MATRIYTNQLWLNPEDGKEYEGHLIVKLDDDGIILDLVDKKNGNIVIASNGLDFEFLTSQLKKN